VSATLFDLEDGSQFVADERHVPEVPPFGAFGDDEEKIKSWVGEKWNILWQLKRGETERLKTCELFYAGFHYQDVNDVRGKAITNYCHSTVETIWPILTQSRPRPEPVPRSSMDVKKVKRLRDYATYKMDVCGFDRIFRICTRDFLKYGWCCPIIRWDSRGNAVPIYWSPFDFYPDSAPDESEMEYFALAKPVSVRRLRELFPAVADKIMPDNIASPSYEVLVQPYQEMGGAVPGIYGPNFMETMKSAVFEGGTPTSTSHYSIDTGSFNVFGQTAFLIQMFVRDYTKMKVRYEGQRMVHDPRFDRPLVNPHSITREEPCCPSGWRMIAMTAGGVLLEKPAPVDECLGGIPVVIGRNYEQGGRFYPKGELDDAVPIQRGVNRSDVALDRAQDLQSNPPVLYTGTGLAVDKSSVEGGEILKLTRGSTLAFLNVQSLAESHFVRRAARRQDMQIVIGTPDSLQGQRPVGVEAAAAIRQLTESASSRARAKAANALEWSALLLEKLIKCDIRKSRDVIQFVAEDGTPMILDPDEFKVDDFSIRWAQNSGTAQGEQDRNDLNMQLLQMGVIDPQQVLEDLNYPGRQIILQRVGLQRLQMAAAAGQNGSPSKNGGGK
jgi:hypothetical protein